MNRFINNYDVERLQEISDLLDESYANLPFSIVAPLENYEQNIQKNSFLPALKFAINFFEISIQYTSGLLISLLNYHQAEFDEQLQNILARMVDKQLSFGDWVNDIFLVLIKKSNNFIPEHPLVSKLFVEFFEAKRSGDAKISKKGENFKSIIYYRNKEAHDAGRSNEVYKEMITNIEPWIWEMLDMMQPLKLYQFFVLDQIINTDNQLKSYIILPDRGTTTGKKLKIDTNFSLDEYAYYVTDQTLKHWGTLDGNSIIKISPFVIYHYCDEVKQERKVSYVFQTVADKNLNRMVFISADKDVSRKETELFKEDFSTFLKRIFGNAIGIEKFKVIFRKGKTLAQYQELVSIQTNQFINQQKNSDKYDPALFINRIYLSENFANFMQGNCSAFVILGNAGAGKTNQLCHWASSVADSNTLSLAFYSKNFTALTLEEQLQQTFNSTDKTANEILESLNTVLAKSSAKICVLFDAINECTTYKGFEKGNGPIDLLLAIHQLFVGNTLTQFKIIISCRSYTWEEVLNKDVLMDHAELYYTMPDQTLDQVVLKGFSDVEFSEVYPKYALKYNLHTSLNKMLEDAYAFVRMRLYDPLILKTASQNFSDKEFPADVRQFNSTRLFKQRLDTLQKQTGGALQLNMLEEFTAILWKDFTDSIPLRSLFAAYEDKLDANHKFAHRVFKDDTFRYSESFIVLLDEGILRIEKGFKKEIRFVYERFNEFLFANHFILSQSLPVYNKIPVVATAYEDVLKISGHSTVIIAALRNALIMDFYEKKHDPATIIRLSLSQVYEAQPLVEETLSVLIEESYTDVLKVLEQMLDYGKEESGDLFKQKTEKEKVLNKEKNKLKLTEVARQKLEDELQSLNEQLLKILKVRQIAVSVIYKIFKSEHINTWLGDKEKDPAKLLWIAMADPLPEVRDNASIYIYYIARYNIELGTNLISSLSDKVKKTQVLSLVNPSSRKELQQSYIEPACRVGLFLVIDGLIERQDYKLASDILKIWKDVVRKFSLNHTLIKVVMPFFKFLFARQTVVQTEYVNNGIEYRHFWDVIPLKANPNNWSREAYKMLVSYLDANTKGFKAHQALIISAYLTGDSFSFFLLERIMIVQGLADWNNIADIIQHLLQLPESERFKPYIEMSLIYSLFQINHKSTEAIPQAEKIFSALVKSWSVKQKGYYYAHYNNIANNGKPYKQYVLYWYASAYCNRYGDGISKPGDDTNVPVFRALIYIAHKNRDKALLYNCLENMAILVSAAGYYKTALQLFEYLIGLFKTESEIVEFDNMIIPGSVYAKGVRSFICDVLGTVKSYYPKQVDHFIVNKLKASQFPDLDAFREEIFNHALSHEGIGDLLTHKFGNFVIWGIISDANIRQFFIEICDFGYASKNYPEWFDHCIRHVFQELFEVKNLQKT